MATLRRGVRKDSLLLKGLATCSLSMLWWVYEQYKLDLFKKKFLGVQGGDQKGEGLELGGLRSQGDQGILCEIPKQSVKTLCKKICTYLFIDTQSKT